MADIEDVKRAIDALGVDVRRLRDERDPLRRKLTAHHELSTLSDEVVRAYMNSHPQRCPVCADVDSEVLPGQTT